MLTTNKKETQMYTLPDNTFFMDFAIANRFGKSAILDTFKRCSKEWGKSPDYSAALSIALDQHCYRAYTQGHHALSDLYESLRDEFYDSRLAYFEGDDKNAFLRLTD